MIYTSPTLGKPEREAIKNINELWERLRWQVAEPRRWLGSLRRLTFAKAVQGSNSIEGYNASLEDVIAAVEDEEPLDAETETVLALQGYRDALTYVLQLADDENLAINTTLLRSLHYMMIKHDLSKRPGRWRKGDIYVRREPDDVIVYEGPDVSKVPALMNELVDSLHDGDGAGLVRASMAHLNLAMIHPFSDGNGRMARCLQTLVLTRDHILAPVFCSIEEYLGSRGNTERYYQVLGEVGQGSWHPKNDARPWVRFCLNAHFTQARTLLWRVKIAQELWNQCQELVDEFGLPERTIGPLSDAARGLRLRNATYRVAAEETAGYEVDVQTASRDLRQLVNVGLLVAQGETRGRIYAGTGRLRSTYARLRAEKPVWTSVDLFSGTPVQLDLGFAS